MRLPPLPDHAHSDRQALIQSVQAATAGELLLQAQLERERERSNQLEHGIRNALTLITNGHSAHVRRVLERALIF